MSTSQPHYKKSLALVIGINSYADAQFVPLGEAENDARTVADLLKEPPFEFEVGMLLGDQATRQRILDAIYTLRKAEEDDRVLVYFAGHGYTETDNFGQETGYLAAVDTIHDRNSSALKLTDITDLRRFSNAMHIGFIFDACFSGQALGITRGTAEVLNDRRRAFQVISAGAGDQTVSDYNSMTDVMIEALRGQTPESEDMLTFNSLGLYLQQTVSARSGRMQIPQFGSLTGHQGDDLVLYYDTSPHLPRELEHALDSSSANVRRGAVAELVEIAHGDDRDLALLADNRLTEMLADPEEMVRNEVQRFIDPAVTRQHSTVGRRTPPEDPEAASKSQAPWAANPFLWIVGGVGALLAAVFVIGLLLIIGPVVRRGGAPSDVAVGGTPLAREDLDPTQQALVDDTSGTQQEDVIPEDLVLLDVRFFSQNEDSATFSEHDEGPACLAMVIYAQTGETIPIDDLYAESGIDTLDPLSSGDLIHMAAEFNIGLREETDITFDDIRGWIDSGQPVIVPVDYRPFLAVGGAPEGADEDHMVLVVGYDDENFYIHDPLYQQEYYADSTAGSILEVTPPYIEPVPPDELGSNRAWPLVLFSAVWQGSALVPGGEVSVAQVEFTEPTGTDETNTGFDSPVGTEAERSSDEVWPGGWIDATGYGTLTASTAGESYHSGVDLNLNTPTFDADKNAPVYATASGVVIYADKLGGVWGNVVIIRHDALESGEVYWSRYSPLGELLVEKGEQVERGQQIGTIGNADGRLPYFLHFDIAKTNVLEINPGHWPGISLESVLTNYVDPREFIATHRPENAP